MTNPTTRRIVVALDGTDASQEALRWAAWQSQLTGHDLALVHVYVLDTPPHDRTQEFHVANESWHRAHATRWLREALDESPAIPHAIRLVVVPGTWRDTLEAQVLHGAELVVAGAGTAASSALRHGPALACPLVLVPGVRTESPTSDEEDRTRQRLPRLVGAR